MRSFIFVILCIITLVRSAPAEAVDMAKAPVFRPTVKEGVAKLIGELTYEASANVRVLYCINHKKVELDCIVLTDDGLLLVVPIVGSQQEASN